MNVLVGLVAAVIAGLGLAADRFVDDPRLFGWTAVGASVLLLGFGLMTLRRIMERNLATTDFLNGLRLIRIGFLLRDPAAVGLLPFMSSPDPLTRSKGWGLGKAGFLETVALVNSVVAAVAVAVVAGVTARDTIPWGLAAPAAAMAAWVLQIAWSRRVYRNEAKQLGSQRQNALRWWIEELKSE